MFSMSSVLEEPEHRHAMAVVQRAELRRDVKCVEKRDRRDGDTDKGGGIQGTGRLIEMVHGFTGVEMSCARRQRYEDAQVLQRERGYHDEKDDDKWNNYLIDVSSKMQVDRGADFMLA